MHHRVAAAGLIRPEGVAALLAMALVIDWMSIGPNSLRDRIAFLLALPAIYAGWEGSDLANFTTSSLAHWLALAKTHVGSAYMAQAATAKLVSVTIGVVAIFAVGCLLPESWAGRLGGWTKLTFSGGVVFGIGAGTGASRLNGRLWACAILLGLTADDATGLIGMIVHQCLWALTGFAGPIPTQLFG